PKVEEQWTYDLFSDAPPFPEDGPLTPGLPSDPDRQRASSPQEISPVQTRPSGKTSDKGPPSDSRREPRVGGEQEQWSGRLVAESLKVSNPSVSPGGEEEEQSASKHEEGTLQSCPMCLHVFPSGFTQMERDGHLAQCLSELSVDMTW
uniref:UBZ2-type domain-containing protein n=1 Tax=Poecilia formosa TaxID=48698 RepID=A0A096LQT8_POEFO